MKCDIILDLLPLYVEDLCRPESKKAVAEHLAGCADCQDEYQKLLEELLPKHSKGNEEGDEIEQYLKERDLFQKSKTAVRDSLLSQGGRVAGMVVFITALLCNIGMFFFVIKGYYLRYPALKLDESAGERLWILLLPLLPTAVSLTGVVTSYCRSKGKTTSRTLNIASRASLWLLVPSILIGGLFTIIFMVIPPLYSYTDNPGHYMKIDKDMERYQSALLELFPEKIPEQADHISYQYQKYSALFSDTMIVECTFTLPNGLYSEIKSAGLDAPCFNKSPLPDAAEERADGLDVSDGSNAFDGPVGSNAFDGPVASGSPNVSDGSGSVTAAVLPEGVTLTFSFDDSARSVRYRAELDKSN